MDPFKKPIIQYHWVIGATGFVGKHLVRELLERYHNDPLVQIVAVGHQRIEPIVMEKTHFLMMPLDRIEKRWFIRFPPTHFYHCARMAGSNDFFRSIASARGFRANMRLKKILEDLPSPPIVVYCSGTLMYGNNKVAVDESAPIKPISYARKYERAERPWYIKSKKMHIRMAFPAWIFGGDSWFISFYIKPSQLRKKVPIYGDGNQQMSLIHVQDVAGQLIHIAEQGIKSNHYNVYGTELITQANFAETVANEIDLETDILSSHDIETKYGKTVYEALTSSMPIKTQHINWRASYKFKFPNWRKMVAKVIRVDAHD
jgi:nucleoside-diphosphate-sugar epimerase